WLAQPAHRINRAAYELLREGMTQAEVEAIFGVPPGDYASVDLFVAPADRYLFPREFRAQEWLSDEGCVGIAFRPDGTVAVKHFARVSVATQHPKLNRILRRLGGERPRPTVPRRGCAAPTWRTAGPEGGLPGVGR